MSIKAAVFFPCAGFGTRMGSIGKELPKPLWPLFSSNFLELSIQYANSLQLKNVFINVHHKKELILRWAESSKIKISVSVEEEILGSGGCFHQLKVLHPNLKELFIFNPDSFLILSNRDWEKFFKLSLEAKYVLIAVKCKKEDKYNRLVVKHNKLERIDGPSLSAPLITYSGFGKVDLKCVEYKKGNSGFFESVLMPGKGDIRVFVPEESYEFWDFGTLESYIQNIQRLLSEEDSQFKNFLTINGHLQKANIQKNSFNSENYGVINFTNDDLEVSEPGIYVKVADEVKKLGN